MFVPIKNKHIIQGDQFCGATDWSNCKKCKLHLTRNKVAMRRFGGTGHTKLLFIGDIPDETANTTGIPFTGQKGRLLHHLIKHTQFQFRYCLTNTVGCKTLDITFTDTEWDDKVDENFDLSKFTLDLDYELYHWDREPTKAERDLCKPHIDELMESFQPHGVIYLGKVAESYTDPKYLVSVEALVSDPDSRFYKHTSHNADWAWRHIPTLSLIDLNKLLKMEYKLLTVRKEARKLDQFVERFIQ